MWKSNSFFIDLLAKLIVMLVRPLYSNHYTSQIICITILLLWCYYYVIWWNWWSFYMYVNFISLTIVYLTSPEPQKHTTTFYFTSNFKNANTIEILATFLLWRYSSLNMKPYQSCTLNSLWSLVSTYIFMRHTAKFWLVSEVSHFMESWRVLAF